MITNQICLDSNDKEIAYYELEKTKYEDIIKEYKRNKRNNSEQLTQIKFDIRDYEYMKDYYDSMIKVTRLGNLSNDVSFKKLSASNNTHKEIDVVLPKNKKRNEIISNVLEIICNRIITDMIRKMI